MKLWDLIRIANRNLLRSKLRTFLTVMAIFVGAFTLTLTNGIGDGLRDYIETQVKNIEGNKILFVTRKMPVREGEQDTLRGPQEYKETKEDDRGNLIDPNSLIVSLSQMRRVAAEMKDVKTITPAYGISGEYITIEGHKKYKVSLGMLSEGIVQKLEAGKKFDGANQVILPLSQAKAFSENLDSLIGKTAILAYKFGKDGEIKKIDLKIVGISTKGMFANNNSFVDTETAKSIYTDQSGESPNFNQFRAFTFQLRSGDEKLIKDVKDELDGKGFNAITFNDIKKRTYDAIGILQIGLNLFALIALLAASFGIINTLIIAVMERTKDIGLQKALGMGRGKIFMLFSFESIFIGFWGAVLGILGGIAVGTLANLYLAQAYLESFEEYTLFVFTPFAIAFIIILVSVIAFLAGVLPAYRASRLNPIEALRYE